MRILSLTTSRAPQLLRAFEGAEVRWTGGSALEAEACIRARRPDVVVLDLRMPGMSGSGSARG